MPNSTTFTSFSATNRTAAHRRPVARAALGAMLCALLAAPALANPRSLSFSDPAGDAGPVGDAVQATLSWDSASGQWTVHWQADPVHPFSGSARFNLNLFDTALAPFTGSSLPQLTLDALVDFGAGSATEFSYSGTNAYLANWQLGDLVSTGNGSSFYSGVMDQNSAGRDPMITTATVDGRDNTVPEPATLALALGGLVGVAWLSRRRLWSGGDRGQ